jgi:hypothetical protein
MKNLIVSIFTCFFLVVLNSPSLWAGTFFDDFDDGDAEGWEFVNNKFDGNDANLKLKTDAKWEVKNGKLCGTFAESAEAVAVVGDDSWSKDVTIEAKISDVNGPWLALVWNWQNIDVFDSWWINVDAKTVEAWPKFGPANYPGVKATANVPFDPKKEHILKVVSKGSKFDVFFDGKEASSYTNDEHVKKGGKVGVLVWQTSACFDDIKITGPNAHSLAVHPLDKCSITWGRIKQIF